MSTKSAAKAKLNGAAKKPSITSPEVLLEERIQRVTELRGITAKRARSLETLNKLRTFKYAGDDSCTLEIRDAAGNRFGTGNSNLIALLSEHLEGLLQGKLTELNQQIVDFSL